MQIPEDLDSAPGKLGVTDFSVTAAIARTPYGLNEFGIRQLNREDVLYRIGYVNFLDANPLMWIREFGREPSEDEKAFGRWALTTGLLTTWDHALNAFFMCQCLMTQRNGITTLADHLAQSEITSGSKGAPSGLGGAA